MEKDVVCGMQVDETATAHRFDHIGKSFYFCLGGVPGEVQQEPGNLRQ